MMKAGFMLNNGCTIPAIGLGTFQGEEDNSKVKEIVLAALEKGYRHIDTASAYGNEKDVGLAIRESSIPRDEIFITTKLYGDVIGCLDQFAHYDRAQTWHKPSDVAKALQRSLDDLLLDYGTGSLDLYLIHFPYAYATGPTNNTLRHSSGNGKPVIDYELSRAYPEVWKAMEALVDDGKAKAIGLSNFNILKTKRILRSARITPAVNQVELHPYLPQQELLEFCNQNGILLVAHQPLGGRPLGLVSPNASRPGPLEDSKILEMAAESGRTPAQLILSWAIQRGTAVIPKTSNKLRLAENLEIAVLNEKDFETINSLAREANTIRYLDPKGHVGFDVFDELRDEPVTDDAPWD
ncbi:hypothetical protein MMC17_001648 [Xylographa soralifera]|nr:hypothetical protein [Xylographa soralifera]